MVVGLNIKNEEVEHLATEVARLTGESKTEAIRRALELRMETLGGMTHRARVERAFSYLRDEVWPNLTPEQRKPITKAEREEILGIGPNGYCE